MTIDNRECAYLLKLLSCALRQEEAPKAPEGLDFSVVFSIAKKQQIYNIIFPLIKDMDVVPDSEKERWKNYSYSELVRTIAVDHDRQLLTEELEKHGIKYMFLKGLILRNYYPKSIMRQMSDNDILYDASKRDELLAIMKKRGYKLETCCENSDDFHKEPYFTFEFHRELFFEEQSFCPRFDNLWERAVQDGEHPCQYHMDVSDNYIYSVAHMYKHFSTNGCGVRFLADIYLLYTKEQQRLDGEYIVNTFHEIGIADFADNALKLALRLFNNEELTESDIRLLNIFMKGGVYGDARLTLVRRFDEVKGQSSAQAARRKYILKRLFPSRKTMTANFKVLEKRPYLLGAYYIIRLMRLFVKGDKALAEAKEIRRISEEEKKDD